MKKLILIIAVAAVAYFGLTRSDYPTTPRSTAEIGTASNSDDPVASAFKNHRSDVQAEGQGTVTKILPDDTDDSRHQRFIIRLASGQTLLVAHNIDLAPRIDSLEEGDTVLFNGEYEWNPKGGVIHWTHSDPDGNHEAGWIKHNGRTYQ